MIGGANHDGLEVLVVEHPAEVAVRLRTSAHGREAGFQPRLVDLSQRRAIHVLQVLEILDVLNADQSVADETDLHPIVGAQQSVVGGRG